VRPSCGDIGIRPRHWPFFSSAVATSSNGAAPDAFLAAVIDLTGARETVRPAMAGGIDLSQQHFRDAALFGAAG
jgi:hypothetical protein